MTPLSHSLSAPTFSSNAFSNYSYSPVFPAMTSNATQNATTAEDIQRLTNGNPKTHPNVVRDSKAKNNDLIDLVDIEEGKSVIEMFDPLSCQESNDLNFSNNFVLDSESSAPGVSDEIDKHSPEVVVKEMETNESKPREKRKDSTASNSSDICQPFRVVSRKCRANEELDNYVNQLVVLRRQYKYNDYIANSGLVISPTLDSRHDNSLSVKLVIETQLSVQPISFTCNVDTSVEHIISHVICTLVEDASNVSLFSGHKVF
jgi:hypothetical protein